MFSVKERQVLRLISNNYYYSLTLSMNFHVDYQHDKISQCNEGKFEINALEYIIPYTLSFTYDVMHAENHWRRPERRLGAGGAPAA